MKFPALVLAALLVLAFPANWLRADPPAGTADKVLTADSPVDDILDALDQAGKSLKDFTADVQLHSIDSVANEKTEIGRILYQKKTGDDVRIRIIFDKTIIGDLTRKDKTDYLLDNGWMIEQDSEHKKLIKRQVVRPGEKINPLKLGEGPFPLPIGQDKADVLKNFKVDKVTAAKEDPANTVHLTLTPLPGTRLARKYGSIDVWVDAKTHFPVRIQTVDPRQSDFITVDLTNLKLNPGLKDDDFKQPDVKDYEEKLEPLDGDVSGEPSR